MRARGADHERPHADARKQQRHRHGHGDERDDHLEQPQPDEVHPAEEHPLRRLQREGDRQVGDGERQRQQAVVVVDGRQQRRARRDRQRGDHVQRQLDGERALELGLLVGRRLLDERLVDPDPPQRDDRHRGRGDDPVEADRVRPEQRGGQQPLHEHERLGAGEEHGVDRTAARSPRAQTPRAPRVRRHEPRC